jgi:FAD-dependent urate hydroxylase
MSDAVDVAIVGAGPYGLSVAAHLRGAGVSYRQFGLPMHLWRDAMPRGMFLKSQGFASSLSDPERSHTLEAFCAKTGRPYASYGLPVSLDTFVSYGQWFADELVPGLEEILVIGLVRTRGGFELSLSDGTRAQARNVVLAAGVEHFARVPQLLSGLGPDLCTHTSQHTDLSGFAGQGVVVVGAGQSALESAALLHESGADVSLLARATAVAWNGQPLDPARPLLQRMAEPESGLGSGYSTWFYSRHPELFRLLPERTRIDRARTAMGPAGGWWLRDRVEGQFPVLTGHVVTSAADQGGIAALSLRSRDGSSRELAADHVIAATGYRPDISRLSFLDSGLAAQLSTVDDSIAVDRAYQSSVPGLYVVGPAVTPTMGPVMRFVYGSEHASTTVARRLAGSSRGLVRAPAPATR